MPSSNDEGDDERPFPTVTALPLVCTVIESDSPKWNHAVAPFRSLLRRRGTMAACERAAYFRGEIASEPPEALAALGVVLKVINGESCDAPGTLIPALLDPEETKFLVVLAPKMMVKGDFSEWIDWHRHCRDCDQGQYCPPSQLEIPGRRFPKAA